MIQHCDFLRLGETDEHRCQRPGCGKIVASPSDHPLSQCAVEVPDPPERDPATLPCRWRGELLHRQPADAPGTRRELVSVYACGYGAVPDSIRLGSAHAAPSVCSLDHRLRHVKPCLGCPYREAPPEARVGPPEIAPIRSGPMGAKSCEGMCPRKPWQYDVAVMIPVLDAVESLPLVVELLRLQTLRPYVLLIDTGSLPENLARVEALRAEDVEVHSLRLNGFEHSSQSVAMACDVAFAVAQTRFLFLTHSDCFLRSRTVLEEFAELCQDRPVVGYQISPRHHQDWRQMVGHTATLVDLDEMLRCGVTWNFRRLCRAFGVGVPGQRDRPNWPDTELGFHYACQSAGLPLPLLVGTEENGRRTLDGRIDHVRSYPSNMAYAPGSARHDDMAEAMQAARERIARWSSSRIAVAPREWRRRETTPQELPRFGTPERWKFDWFDYAAYYDDALRRLPPGNVRILEIGVCEGRSTVHLARGVRELGLRAEIHAIDLFEAREQYQFDGVAAGADFSHIAGANLRDAGVADLVTLHKGASADVLPAFAAGHFDLIFIDGSHRYEDVRRDLRESQRLLKPGGILAGHDHRLPDVGRALRDEGVGYAEHGSVWEATRQWTRGIVYVAWGDQHLAEAVRSAASAKALGYATCLLTDDPRPFSAFDMQRVVDFSAVPELGDPMFRKWICLVASPFDATCYLDTDTRLLGSIDLGFDLAERFAIAATLSPGGIFEFEEREYIHYNGGCLYFRGMRPDLRDAIYAAARQTAGEGHAGDEAPLSVAFSQLCLNPAVLPPVFNCVRAGKVHDRPIKILHSRWSRATHLVSDDRGDEVATEVPCPA